MNKFFLFVLVLSLKSFSQQSTIPENFHKPEAIKSFADFLYCDNDFLRASIEYEKYLEIEINDTVQFKLALSYSSIQNNLQAIKSFKNISSSSALFGSANNELMKNYFLISDLDELKKQSELSPDTTSAKMFLYLGLFSNGSLAFGESEFANTFPEKNRDDMKMFYTRKSDPGYKSPLLASCLSAILPGAGKFYTNRWGDGITALITTGLLTFLTIDNFNADHNFRGWLFAGLGFFIYAGDVYGSGTSAHIYNEDVDREFEDDYKNYIESENYFIPKIELCK